MSAAIYPFPFAPRHDGIFAVGWHDDAAGPFESRWFPESVALREARHATAS